MSFIKSLVTFYYNFTVSVFLLRLGAHVGQGPYFVQPSVANSLHSALHVVDIK
jgi:hypothetical protein